MKTHVFKLGKKKLTFRGEEGRKEGKPTESISKECDVVDTAFKYMSNSRYKYVDKYLLLNS